MRLSAALALAPLLVLGCNRSPAAGAPPDAAPLMPTDAGTLAVDGGLLAFSGLLDKSDSLPPNSQSTTDVLLVDVNGDGRPDIVWSSQDWPAGNALSPPPPVQIPGGLAIDLNDGGGKFHRAELSGLEQLGPWQFLLALDADGDGDQDLVLSRAARMTPEVTLLLNDGQGHFSVGAGLPSDISGATDGLMFGRVVAADVDKDGRPDLLLPIFADTTLSEDRPNLLLMNLGMGQFQRDTSGRLPPLAAGQRASLSIAAGDVNGDGAVDLFFGAAQGRQRLLLNDGAGRFSDQSDDDGKGLPRLPLDKVRAYHSAMVDVDGDGDLDITVINDAPLADGIAVPTENRIFRNDGTGHFTYGWMAAGVTALDSRGLGFGDLNHDGILDVAISNATEYLPNGGNALQVAVGTGGGGFALLDGMGPWNVGVFGVALGDLNGDGFADVVGAVAEPDPSGAMKNLLLLSRTK